MYNVYSGSALILTGLVYEAAVLMGGLGHSLVWPYKGLIGCSPGVYGLIGGCWVLYLFNKHKLDPIVAFILPVVLAGQLLGDLFSYLFMYSPDIGYISHFFGFCTGVFTSLVFLLWDCKREDWLRKGAGLLGLVALALQVYFLAWHSAHTWPPEPFARPFLHNMKQASCCSQLLRYARDHEESVDTANAQTYCYNDELYEI